LIAYTSVSHMGFVVLGVASWQLVAVQGAVLQMLAHGLATGALFAIAGMVDARFHSRELAALGGLWARLPRLSGFALLFILASVGVPGMGNFIGELLTLLGAWAVTPALVAVAAGGLVAGTVAMLRLMQRAFHGTAAATRPLADVADIGGREILVLAALAALLIALGLFPQPALRSAAPALEQLTAREVVYDPADPQLDPRRTRIAAAAPLHRARGLRHGELDPRRTRIAAAAGNERSP
jgi:NADH-quinone oxidoreductase subunit M